MKLIEIPFDIKNHGKPGIVYKYRNGECPHTVAYKSGWRYIWTIHENGSSTRVNFVEDGTNTFNEDFDLIQYRELEQMTPDEWWETNALEYSINGFVIRKSNFDYFIKCIRSGEVVIEPTVAKTATVKKTVEDIANEYYVTPASNLFERFTKAIRAGIEAYKNGEVYI